MIKPEIDLELSIKALEVYPIEPAIIKSMLSNLQKVVKQNSNLQNVSGSALIAEFLGSKFINDAPEDYPNGYYYQPEGVEYDCPTGEPDEWCFNSSWDWLMPVVEKIEKQFTVKIIRYADECSNICEIETIEDDPLQITYCYGYDYDGKTKIQVVFDAVVEFIKWWNASLS